MKEVTRTKVLFSLAALIGIYFMYFSPVVQTDFTSPTGLYVSSTLNALESRSTLVEPKPLLRKTRFSIVKDSDLSLDLSNFVSSRSTVTYSSSKASIAGSMLTYTPPLGFVGEITVPLIIRSKDHNLTKNLQVTVNAPAGLGVSSSSSRLVSAVFTSCGTIAVPGSHSLGASIAANKTCLTLASDNIVFDCSGFNITFGINGSSSAFGINGSNLNNVTIRNCDIEATNTTGGDHTGIFLVDVSEINLLSNSIFTRGTDSNSGIRLSNITDSIIKNNTINATGETDGLNIGIEVVDRARNVSVLDNSVTTNSTGDSDFGISFNAFGSLVDNNTIANNTIKTGVLASNGSTNYGIYVEDASNVKVVRNVVITNGVDSNIALNFEFVIESLIRNNTLFPGGNGTTNYGIQIFESGNNSARNNSISTFGTVNNFGVELFNTSQNNITFNEIFTTGTADSNTGIDISSSSLNNVSNNVVDTFGVDSFNIGIETSGSGPTGNVISSNVINTLGIGAFDCCNFGVSLTEGDANTVTRNNIHTAGVGSTQVGLFIVSGANTVTDNTVFTVNGSFDNHGIEVGSSGNTFARNNISTNGTFDNNGIFFDAPVSGNTFVDHIITTRGNNSFGINNVDSNSTYTNILLTNVSEWVVGIADTSNTFTNITYENSNGKVNFMQTLVYSGPINITQAKLNISNNSLFINSTNLSVLNATARVTLNNISFFDPIPRVDFDDDGVANNCLPPQCTEVGYEGTTFVFDVSSFTTYISGEGLGLINLTAIKTPTPNPVVAGSTLTYVIQINNTGNATAFNVSVFDPLQAGLTFISSVPTNTSNGLYLLGNISAGGSSTLTISTLVASGIAGAVINNTANISFQNITNSTFTFNTSGNASVIPPASGKIGGGTVIFTPAIIQKPAKNYPLNSDNSRWATPLLGLRDSVTVNSGKNNGTFPYEITVLAIVANQITLRFDPPGVVRVIAVGDVRSFDLNYDGSPDIRIEGVSVEQRLVKMTVVGLNKPGRIKITSRVPQAQTPTSDFDNKKGSKNVKLNAQKIQKETEKAAVELEDARGKFMGTIILLLLLLVGLSTLFVYEYKKHHPLNALKKKYLKKKK